MKGKMVMQPYAAKLVALNDHTAKIAGWGVVFDSSDLEGEQFAATCDFKSEWYQHPPLLYDHTLNAPQEQLGHVTSMKQDSYGVWIEAELDRSRAYTNAVLELVDQGVIGFSTGSAAHLVRREDKSITQWPILEVSLTTTPCEPRTIGVQRSKGNYPLHITDKENQTAMESTTTVGNTNATPLPNEVPTMTTTTKTTTAMDTTTTNGEGVLDMKRGWMDERLLQRIDGLETTMKTLMEAPTLRSTGFVLPGDTAHDTMTSNDQRTIKAWDAYIREGYRGGLKAAMQESTPAEGGYLVPTAYSQQLVAGLHERSILRRAGARVLRVAGTDSFKVPAMTHSAKATKTGEEAAFNEASPTFDEITFTPTKLTRLVKVSDELVADSRIDLMRQVLIPDYEQAFAAAENDYFCFGSGTGGDPQGVTVGAANSGITTDTSTTLTADNIIDTYHALGYLYRQNACWLMNDSTIKQIRKLKESSTGNYLWQPGLQANQPDTILGRPVFTLNAMPEFGMAGSRVIVFGDLNYFWIVDFGQESIRRLDELYAGTGQVGFRAYRRISSYVMFSEAIVYTATGS